MLYKCMKLMSEYNEKWRYVMLENLILVRGQK